MIFELEDYIFNIEKEPGQTDKHLNTKGWFIAHQKPNVEDYDYIEKFANIYSNIIHLGCKYNNEIISELNKLGKIVPFYQPIKC